MTSYLRRAPLIAAACATGLGATLLTAASPPGADPALSHSGSPPVIREIRATPSTTDEGGSVELFATVEADDPAALRFEWDFGDGSDPTVESGAAGVRHRYRDGGEGGSSYTVRLRVTDSDGESAEGTTSVRVNNVAPTIRVMDREGTPLEGATITFVAGAVDRGVDDELIYSWTFGDGTTARGPRVEHRFGSTGAHTVTLSVDDGDGGTDERTMTVMIGEGGAFSVSGDVSVPEVDVRVASVGGTPTGNGMCQIIVSLAAPGEAGLSFTTVLPSGLAKRSYGIGTSRGGEAWAEEFRSPGSVMASLSVDSKYDPDERSLFGFRSVGGTLNVEYFDGKRLEATFALSLRESTVESARPPPQRASVEGWLAQPVSNRIIGAGSIGGKFYLCPIGAEPLGIVAFEPARESATNMDLDEPMIEVEFDAAVDPATIHDESFRVEYRLPDGPGGAVLEKVDGAVVAVDDRTFRFVPAAPLLDGVRYRVRIVGGEQGVRGTGGASVERPQTWFFSTLVEPDVRVATYQVARNAALVPGKTTLTRVYVDWREKTDVHPDWQVREYPARVEVKVNGSPVSAYPARSETLRRPDQFTAEDSAQARLTVNFFGWSPTGVGGSSTIQAVVEPESQRVSTPRRFESAPLQVDHHTAAPELTYEAYRVLVGPWEEGVPAAEAGFIDAVLEAGAEFTVQNFPIVDFTGSLGDFPLAEPFMISWDQENGMGTYRDPFGAVKRDEYLARQIHDMVVSRSDADVLLLFFPGAIQPAYAGYSFDFPMRTVGVMVSDSPGEQAMAKGTGTIAHEVGHAFGLPHASSCARGAFQECLNRGKAGSDAIEGFRLALDGSGGANKSKTEGNAEAPTTRAVLSLMYPDGIGAPGLFILDEQYEQLMEHERLSYLPDAPRDVLDPGSPLDFRADERAARSGPSPDTWSWPLEAAPRLGPSSQASSWIHVSGLVVPGDGRVVVHPLRHVETEIHTGDSRGPYDVVLLDGDANVLRRASFATAPVSPVHRVDNDGILQGAENGDGGWFSLTLPHSETATTLLIEREGVVLMRLETTPTAPAVEFTETPSDDGGKMTVAWAGRDADGDAVGYMLLYSPSGEGDWQPLTPWTTATRWRVDPARMVSGPRPTLRVLVSDGFRSGQATTELRRE